MKYTKKQFFKDVEKEAKALRKHATLEEKERLDFDSFLPSHENSCIYGQIGEGCRSIRSVSLMTKCCTRFFENLYYDELKEYGNFTEAKKYVNGVVSEEPYSLSYISSIEAYIVLPKANNEGLIDFLKGKTNKLVL